MISHHVNKTVEIFFQPLITFSGVRTLLTLYEFLPSPQAKIYRLKNHIQSFSPDDRDIQSLVLF
jgi:hypothetical protein